MGKIFSKSNLKLLNLSGKMASSKRAKGRERSLNALDESVMERHRLENVLAKIAKIDEELSIKTEEERIHHMYFTTGDLRELVQNFGVNPLSDAETAELVQLLDPLQVGKVLVDRAVAILMGTLDIE